MGSRVRYGRVATAAMLATAACAPMACGAILGIDPGTALGDASTETGSDVNAVGEGGSTVESGIATPSDGGEPGPSSDATQADAACSSAPDWCNDRCGKSTDNCGVTRDCADNCGASGTTCNPQTNQCECTPDPTWCAGRCGVVPDSCGTGTIDCMQCEAGACMSHVCGCSPDSDKTACEDGNQVCGQAVNNCGLVVNCGAGGTQSCPNDQVCMPDKTCCAPDNATACGNQCNVTVTNNCNQQATCPASICPNGQKCAGTTCCTFSSCP